MSEPDPITPRQNKSIPRLAMPMPWPERTPQHRGKVLDLQKGSVTADVVEAMRDEIDELRLVVVAVLYREAELWDASADVIALVDRVAPLKGDEHDGPVVGRLRAVLARTAATALDARPEPWVIRKGGAFYRPAYCGYTNHIEAAGLYTRDEAEKEAANEPDRVTAHPLSEFRAEAERNFTIAKAMLDLLNATQKAVVRP